MSRRPIYLRQAGQGDPSNTTAIHNPFYRGVWRVWPPCVATNGHMWPDVVRFDGVKSVCKEGASEREGAESRRVPNA
jgi:hypothetical protein